VATSLIEHVESYALDYQVPCLSMSVFKENLSAIACYKKQGFQKFEERMYTIGLKKKLFQEPF
jgi:ribosomal protein S18 acetylase RimI-like enzyme